MSRTLVFLFLSTFFIGFASGFNIFLRTRDSVPSLPTTDVSSGYDIVYDMYGACKSSGCVSYHVTQDGTATRIVTQDGVQVSRASGTLSATARDALVQALRATPLLSSRAVLCAPVAGEKAARVAIRIAETTYRYDTCRAALPEPLGSLLHNYPSWLTL